MFATRGITAGLALASIVSLAGCGSATKSETSPPSATASTSASASASATPNKTIKDYLAANQIVQTPVQPGEPGAPVVTVPALPGWSDLTTDQTTEPGGIPPYAAKGYDAASDPNNRPVIQLRLAKLVGDADSEQILQLAPADSQNTPGFEFMDKPGATTLSGYDGIAFSGTVPQNGQNWFTASRFIIIPDADPSTTYLVRLNGTAPESDKGPLIDALGIVDTSTTIESG
jgi:hypothetical protein